MALGEAFGVSKRRIPFLFPGVKPCRVKLAGLDRIFYPGNSERVKRVIQVINIY